ncbi:MAG: hypothetical protein Q8W48_09260 [Candidatus Palauibacterales bacterium]|nr:hypothetical protein [Candidatus Palauibacterales bacterium]
MIRARAHPYVSIVPIAALFAVGGDVVPAAAQTRDPAVTEFRLVSDLLSTSSLWVNPAGLGFHTRRSSLMGNLTWDRPEDGDWSLGQYLIGVAADIVGFGYEHDEFQSGAFSQGDAYTLALGVASRDAAIGVSRTWRTVGESQGSWVVGFGFVKPTAAIGLVWRDIGSPTVRDTVRDKRLIGAVTAQPSRGPVILEAELDYNLKDKGLRVFRVGAGMTLKGKLRARGLLGWDGDGKFVGFVISGDLRLGKSTAWGAAGLDAGGDAGNGNLGLDFTHQRR